MAEPIWLTRQIVDLIHIEQLVEHGGRRGLRDENALESALARPRQRWSYEPDTALAVLAASVCVGLVRDHPFVDGNKRVGFLAAYAFLRLNGFDLKADDEEIVRTIEAVASGATTEEQVAGWLAARLVESGE